MEITYKPVGVNETAEWETTTTSCSGGKAWEVNGKEPHSRNEG